MRARTAELENSTANLRESEERRSMAIAAGKMGSWDWDWINGDWMWDEGQYSIFGVSQETFNVTSANVQALLHPDDVDQFRKAIAEFSTGTRAYNAEFRVQRPDGEVRWCVSTAAATLDTSGRVVRVSGVTVDITERKRAEEQQNLLAREVDHRAKNALALAQSIVRLTRADNVKTYVSAVEEDRSTRWRACTPSCRCRAGRVPSSPGCSRKSWRPTRWAARSTCPGRRCSCCPPPRRLLTWRCTSSSPTRPSTAHSRRAPDGWRSAGGWRTECSS